MLLILGQPGIGKSTLIAWIIANFINELDNILVYQFASDLKNIDWQDVSENYNLIDDILMKLNLSYNDLQGKTLIFDGFDEVSISNSRKRILDCLYEDWIYDKRISNFLLIITCRVNYVEEVEWVKCKYITLQPWNERQIKSFCDIFQAKTKNSVSNITIKKLIENREILGIPLILYMTLALDISVEKEGSIVDVYDKIFSLEGGIYDRCINYKNFAEKHRISGIKEQIHQISREIAVWMFENDPDEACIPQKEYQKICNHIMKNYVYEKEDFKIGNFFKTVKHCEGIEKERILFVHRSLYEYFVTEYLFMPLKEIIEKKESEKILAAKLGDMLKANSLSKEILNYLKYKIKKSILSTKFNFFRDTFQLMIDFGMTYFTNKCYRNVIKCEMSVFANMLEILHLWENSFLEINETICFYIKCNENIFLNLEEANLEEMDLRGANLKGANLQNANLIRTDLRGANLGDADLRGANLRGANLKGANIYGAVLTDAIFSEIQMDYLEKEKALQKAKVYVYATEEILSYNEYCIRGKYIFL